MIEQTEGRVLVLAPTGKDATLTRELLGYAGIRCEICTDLGCVVRELERGAGALLVAEEALANGSQALADIVARQPAWSDLPLLILTRNGADSEALTEAVHILGNVILLERPVRVAALASAARSALRTRDRQYRARSHLVERDRAIHALEEADRRKDEFLATLAHELRNPLAPIRNSVQSLRLTTTKESLASLVDIMERQVGTMVRLVDDLLEVSRITRGKIELHKERVELSSVIQAAVETVQPLLASARHQLTLALGPQPFFLEADSVRLAQVFANLLNNAAKYTPDGGHIWVSAARDGDEVVVTVGDDGMGISAASLPQIFDLFAQGDISKNRRAGGLGIGLTLARALADLHGGSIVARSEGPGQGSEFMVRLPLTPDAHAERSELGGPTPQAIRGRIRVLVVDDNQDGANTLRLLLELLGAEVRVEYDGPSALNAFGAFRPEAVLLDIGMPGMDGLEVARRLRRRRDSHDVMLIALTGWGQEKDRRDSEAAGFDHHLIKPVDIEALQGFLAAVHGSEQSRAPERQH